jgi:aminomethyltransferase
VPEASSSLLKTPLTDWHRRRAARMVAFAGFEMPVQYPTGVLAEHAAVREKVGLFDITHMGEIRVEGGGAEAWLDGLVTNRIAGIAPGKVVYTAMCREDGGVLDDMLVYRLGATRWLVVCNAVNRTRRTGASRCRTSATRRP